MKYERALAIQKLNRDPNGVFMEVRYHFAWNVIHRKPVFLSTNDYLDFVHDTFLKCSKFVGGFANLLWLAPDHVHVYVESDGEKSVETIIQQLKEFSRNAIIGEFRGAGLEVGSSGQNRNRNGNRNGQKWGLGHGNTSEFLLKSFKVMPILPLA
ncbi:MAG: transposase [Deltaproteobacteria bacterium]|nr:transposase [Deltaproteobacteria bacterium]MBW2020639.1 transposase [Deltaproteobacteria bacterium]